MEGARSMSRGLIGVRGKQIEIVISLMNLEEAETIVSFFFFRCLPNCERTCLLFPALAVRIVTIAKITVPAISFNVYDPGRALSLYTNCSGVPSDVTARGVVSGPSTVPTLWGSLLSRYTVYECRHFVKQAQLW